MTFSIQNFIDTLSPHQKIWIAYSGGLDSHVLLHALAQSRPCLNLQAIHIHHGLHVLADEWATHCHHICQQLNIPYQEIRVKVPIAPRESVEANARVARYHAITQCIAPNDIVLTAQHANDQAETLLLQLLRGAGVAGLAAMPERRVLGQGTLIRPLLAYTRAELHTYAVQEQLCWIEDSSNADTRFDRNFLRHNIIPLLQHRWSRIQHVLCRAAHHQAEANKLIQILAQNDLDTCQGKTPDQLCLHSFLQLNYIRQKNVLRFWIKQLGLSIPSTRQLEHIFTDLVTAKEDSQPLVRWKGGEVRRYHHALFAMPNVPKPPKSLKWHIPQPLDLVLGVLTVTQVKGGLAIPADGDPLEVRFRQGGETFQWHGHRHFVKKLLQAAQLPPWKRAFIPLIYYQNTLVSIPNIGIADGFVAQDMGWEIQWH